MIEISLLQTMAKCLILTILMETTFAILVLKIREINDVINVILVNILTNPVIVSLLMYLNINVSLDARNYSVLPLEILVVITEGFIYQKVLKYKKMNPYIISLVLNCFSYFLGEVINYFIY